MLFHIFAGAAQFVFNVFLILPDGRFVTGGT